MADQTQDQSPEISLTPDSSPDQTPAQEAPDSSPPASSSDTPKTSLEALTEAVAPETIKASAGEESGDEDDGEEGDEDEPEEVEAKAEEAPEPDDSPREKNWRKLRESNKELKAETEALRQRVSDFEYLENELIKRSGASGEQIAQVFDFLEAVNSGRLQDAVQLHQEWGRRLALATGQALPQASPIMDHPDLVQAVQAGMDERYAVQVAQARFLAQRQQEQARQQQDSAYQRQQFQTQVQSAISQINSLEAEWGKSINWGPVQKVISSQLPEIARNFPPHQWAQQVVLLKNAVEKAARQAAPKPSRSGPQPLRASGQSAGSKQPGNSLDAVNQALGF